MRTIDWVPGPHAGHIRLIDQTRLPASLVELRIQTVDEDRNPRFARLLEAFDRLTGCPVLVNTSFNVRGERREDRVGLWVRRPEKAAGAEDKIAAIGIRVRRWVTFHGVALNIEPDLDHFAGIVPCGVTTFHVPSGSGLVSMTGHSRWIFAP